MLKTIFITGGSRGIGRATAELAAKRFNVAIGYLKSEREARDLARIINDGGGSALAVKCDVENASDVLSAVEQINKKFGTVDVLVTSAGIAEQKQFQDITDDDWRRMMSVNFFGAVNAVRAVLPDMLKKKSGKIIAVASMWGETGAAMESHYSASKAALIGLVKSLAKELGPSGIEVNAVSPGAILTDMLSGFSDAELKEIAESAPLGRLGTPLDAASAIMFLASSSSFIAGEVLRVNGGYLI